jgi:hypothetical protein
MASFFERMMALPAWAWFAAAVLSHTLGSETWYGHTRSTLSGPADLFCIGMLCTLA